MKDQFEQLILQLTRRPQYALIRGTEFPYAFHMNRPADEHDVGLLLSEPSELPESLIAFLRVANGAVLFLDETYGQWGVRIHGSANWRFQNESVAPDSPSTLVAGLSELNRKYAECIPPGHVLFGSHVGDLDLLALRTRDSKGDRAMDTPVFVIRELDGRLIEEIAPSFAVWLDRVSEHRGEKWWED